MFTMSILKGIGSVLIIAMLTLCVLNIAAASTSKLTPATALVTYNGYATNATINQTVLEIMLSSNTTNVNEKVTLIGGLASSPIQTQNFIGGATVNIQKWVNETWTTVDTTTTTAAGDYKGWFKVPITPSSTGVFSYRATYDGDSQYAPTVSNVVRLMVNQQ
jgi:hypothetical protein